MAPPARRPSAVLLVGAFVVVAVIGAALAGPFRLGQRNADGAAFTIPPPALPTSTGTPIPVETMLDGERVSMDVQRWVYVVVIALLGAVLVLGVALLA